MATSQVTLDPSAQQITGAPQAPPHSFDDLFGPVAAPDGTQPQAAPTQAAQDPASGQWFLEAPTGTKYRTAQDAVAGITEKDQTIHRLQQQIQNATQVFNGQQPQAAAVPSFVELLEKAVQPGGDHKALEAYLTNRIQEQAQALYQQQYGSIAPLVQHAGLNRAVEIAASGPKGDPNIVNFVRSQSFRDIATEWPELGEAIQQGASDANYAVTKLPNLIRMAYKLASVAAPAAPAVPAQPSRFPIPSSTTPPTQPVPNAATSGSLLQNMDWSSISASDWATANATPKR